MPYINNTPDRLSPFKDRAQDAITLGIETSCDDTSAAVLRGEREVLSLMTNSQIALHQEFGGVVPELASRDHVKNLFPVVSAALSQANIRPEELDAIAVTNQPGLLGALLTGLSFAKGMALALLIPYIGVNHMFGHISANFLCSPELSPPFLCLIASGGHTQIALVKSYTEYEILGGTLDDAAGEALDKIARALGLPYPGGPHLEALAAGGNPQAYNFRSLFNEKRGLDLSFSGIKTAAINVMLTAKERGQEYKPEDIAASFQHCVVDALVNKLMLAAKMTRIDSIAMAGGVCANDLLRNSLKAAAVSRGLKFYCPDKIYCTDNGAMVACAGYHMLMEGSPSLLTLDACATD